MIEDYTYVCNYYNTPTGIRGASWTDNKVVWSDCTDQWAGLHINDLRDVQMPLWCFLWWKCSPTDVRGELVLIPC